METRKQANLRAKRIFEAYQAFLIRSQKKQMLALFKERGIKPDLKEVDRIIKENLKTFFKRKEVK